MKKLIPVFLMSLLFSMLNAQMSVENEDAYAWFDNAIGVENSGLYVGKEYKENYKFKNNKHKFFDFNGFQKGNLIYDGQPYFNVSLKLDVFENELLVKLPAERGIAAFTLIKDKVDSFTIGDHKFIKTSMNSESEELSWQYQEVLLEAETFMFLKNHFAIKKTIKDERWSYVEFLKKDNHLLLYEGNYYPINSKGDISRIFPEYKKKLKGVSKNYFRGAQRDANLTQLFKELQEAILLNAVIKE